MSNWSMNLTCPVTPYMCGARVDTVDHEIARGALEDAVNDLFHLLQWHAQSYAF